MVNDALMGPDPTFSETAASEQGSLRDQGVLSCDVAAEVSASGVPDTRTARLIRTTTGVQLQVSVPSGLRSPCFRLMLPEQRGLGGIVMDDIEALAARVGPGHPAKGIGFAANQSATLVTMIAQMAEGSVTEQPALEADQRKAAVENGSVPAFFRYQDPDGNVIRMFNPSDATPRNSDGSYAAETDVRPEGCLSSIDFRGQVIRPLTMIVDGEDLEGDIFRITARGPAARLIGHEISHVNHGIDGLCIIESGLPVLTLSEYEKLGPEIINWSYPTEYASGPYLDLSDPAGRLDAPHLRARLIDQRLFTGLRS